MPEKTQPYTVGDALDAVQTFGQYLRNALTAPTYPEVPRSPYATQVEQGVDWYAPPRYRELLLQASARTGVPARLLDLQYNQESRWNPMARGTSGERGIAQLMPATARELGVTNPDDPAQSILGGARYMAYLMDMFGGDPIEALKAYNVGPGNVRAGKNTAQAEQYVRDVFTPKRFGR